MSKADNEVHTQGREGQDGGRIGRWDWRDEGRVRDVRKRCPGISNRNTVMSDEDE